MNRALYLKYRPSNFDEVYGQEAIIQILKNSIQNDTFSHAYLFCGPRGTGKTSVARLVAKAVNCESTQKGNPDNKCENCKIVNENKALDIIEIDAASHTQVDNIREVVIERSHFAPTKLKYKIYIIDEAHMLSKSSFNALLKTLEEPPEHTILILATTEVNKIPSTIISRCQRFDFKRINAKDLFDRLRYIADQEKIKISDEAILSIAKLSEGGFRNAISTLDQLSANSEEIGIQDVENLFGFGDQASIEDLIYAIAQNDPERAIEIIEKSRENGVDIPTYTKNIIEYLRKLLIAAVAGTEEVNMTVESAKRLSDILNIFPIDRIIETIEIFIDSEKKYRYAYMPELALEVSLVKACGQEKKAETTKTIQETAASEISKKENEKPKSIEKPGQWQQVLMEVKNKNNSIHAFLKVCDPEFGDGDLCLYFPYRFHKERIEDVKNRRVVEESLKRVYGKEYRIKCVIKPNLKGEDNTKPKNDDLLKDALEIFGGEVIE